MCCSRLTFHILHLQTFEIDPLPPLLSVFEMFISPELEYPMVCLGVHKGFVSFTFICLIDFVWCKYFPGKMPWRYKVLYQ